MHPQRPLPQAMPSSSLGQHLRNMTMGLGRGKNLLGGNFSYDTTESGKASGGAMSGGGAANNSWTILSSEETVAETLRPFAEGTEQHEESHASAAGPGEKNQPANSPESAEEILPEDNCLVSEKKTADQSADSNSDQHPSVPLSADVSGTLDHGNVESRTEGLTKSCLDPDSSSDSYTLLTPSSDGPPVSLLSTETLGGAEFSQAEEELPQEETLHLQNREEPHLEVEESGESPQITDAGKDGGMNNCNILVRSLVY
ncbi:hypothetical protein CRENBAI_005051 [Crenichthys baileyi]|uniref:Uncharacterized protein n=1 Tax=Crenichthys baileyi TaxID=28760 RepID=A0AAV9SLI6_9TELE